MRDLVLQHLLRLATWRSPPYHCPCLVAIAETSRITSELPQASLERKVETVAGVGVLKLHPAAVVVDDDPFLPAPAHTARSTRNGSEAELGRIVQAAETPHGLDRVGPSWASLTFTLTEPPMKWRGVRTSTARRPTAWPSFCSRSDGSRRENLRPLNTCQDQMSCFRSLGKALSLAKGAIMVVGRDGDDHPVEMRRS